MLNKAKNWVVAGVIALAVLQGSAAVNGEEVKAPEEAVGTPAVVTSISEIEALPPGTKAVIGRNLRDSHLDFLSRVKSIEALTLEQCPDVTDAGAGYIAQLEALDTLDIWWCQKLTGSGLAKLCALPKLAHLTVNVRVALDARRDMNSQDGKAVAEKLNKLASLELRQGSHFPNDGMVHAIVAWLTNITSLSLADNDKLTDTSLKHVATLKRLSKLDLTSGSGFTDAGIAYLRDCAALETLDLSMLDSGMSQDGEGQSIIAQVVKLPHLKELILDGWELRFGRDKLKPLTTGSRLQRLKCGAGHGDESLAQLGKITSLRELDLSGSRVIIGSDEVAGALSGWSALTELRVLDLSGIEWYAGAMVRALPVLPKLEVLRVRNAYATDHGTIDEAALERIATITTLRELDLRQFYLGKEFKPEHFLKLKTLGNLRVMRLSRDVGRNDAERARFNEVMSELGKALPQCRFELEKDE